MAVSLSTLLQICSRDFLPWGKIFPWSITVNSQGPFYLSFFFLRERFKVTVTYTDINCTYLAKQSVPLKSFWSSYHYMSPVKRICVFEHSVMTNFNCACPAIQRGQRPGFLSECSSWLTAYMSEQRRFWRDCADAQARLNLRCSHRL